MFSSPRAAIFSAYGALCWVLFLVTALSALVLTLPLPTVTQRRHVTRTAARLFLGIAGFRLKVVGLDLLPQAPCVLVANHASYLDGLVMHAVLPVRFAFIIKKEMVTVPLAGFLLRRLGSEFVERHDRHRAASDARRVLRRAAGGEAEHHFPLDRLVGSVNGRTGDLGDAGVQKVGADRRRRMDAEQQHQQRSHQGAAADAGQADDAADQKP